MNDQPNFQKEKTQEQKNVSFRSSDEAPRLHRDKMYQSRLVTHLLHQMIQSRYKSLGKGRVI